MDKIFPRKADSMNINKNAVTRTPEEWNKAAEILGIKQNDFSGGIERCEFTVAQLTAVLDLGFISLTHKYNDAPNVETYYNFGKRAEAQGATMLYEGYLESQYRDGSRLIIEGVKVTDFYDKVDLILEFSQNFHDADEFTANAELLRAWYD